MSASKGLIDMVGCVYCLCHLSYKQKGRAMTSKKTMPYEANLMLIASKLSLGDKGLFKGRGIDKDMSPKYGQLMKQTINIEEVDEDPPPWRSQKITTNT